MNIRFGGLKDGCFWQTPADNWGKRTVQLGKETVSLWQKDGCTFEKRNRLLKKHLGGKFFSLFLLILYKLALDKNNLKDGSLYTINHTILPWVFFEEKKNLFRFLAMG